MRDVPSQDHVHRRAFCALAQPVPAAMTESRAASQAGVGWAWDPIAQAYYWHRFYRHQPDLNFDSPQVRKQIFRVLDFWFNMVSKQMVDERDAVISNPCGAIN